MEPRNLEDQYFIVILEYKSKLDSCLMYELLYIRELTPVLDT